MDKSTIGPGSSDLPKVYTLSHTSSGTPYVLLDTKSTIPIYLTPIYKTDVEANYASLGIPSVAIHLISVPQNYTIADAQSWINLQLSAKSNLNLQILRASDPENGSLIGSASLSLFNSSGLAGTRDKLPTPKGEVDEKEYELGYYLHPDWTGRGIMGAAVKALVDLGKVHYGAVVIVRVVEENLPSRKVVEKFKQFVRDESRDDLIDWPVEKGGGKKKLLFWVWRD